MKSVASVQQTAYSRLSCRVSTRIKEQAEIAAAILGQSITDFTEEALADKSRLVIEQHDRIRLSERDFAAFVDAINNPAAPTDELKNAMSEYRELQAAHPESNL